MSDDHFRYDLLAQAALRGVVRTVLTDVAEHGLPGEHHFKITFSTTAPGVQLSDRMRAQYPEAMTIILQHQFWDLIVNEETFEVGLSFGGIAERLVVPFDAVMAFFDPAVQFGLQFELITSADATESGTLNPADEKAGPPVSAKQESPQAPPAPAKPSAPSQAGAQVVSLDRFRKK